jgi:hypothetical protein
MGKSQDMARYEYKVVAAPRRTKAFKGVRAHEDQFAEVLAEVMNEMAASDWEYLRAESLPCEEKTGLTSRVESYQSVLVFRRKIVADQKFFEVPIQRQIEMHKVREDATEHDNVIPVGTRASASTVQSEMQESEEQATQSGVLAILKNRRARLMQDSNDSYPEHMKLAGE